MVTSSPWSSILKCSILVFSMSSSMFTRKHWKRSVRTCLQVTVITWGQFWIAGSSLDIFNSVSCLHVDHRILWNVPSFKEEIPFSSHNFFCMAVIFCSNFLQIKLQQLEHGAIERSMHKTTNFVFQLSKTFLPNSLTGLFVISRAVGQHPGQSNQESLTFLLCCWTQSQYLQSSTQFLWCPQRHQKSIPKSQPASTWLLTLHW